jgi:hypothetical protein
MFASKAELILEWSAFPMLYTGEGSGLAYKHLNRLEKLAREKHSSSLRTFINSGRKKFYNIGPWSALREPSPPARPQGHDLGTLPELKMTGSVNSENFGLITLLA